ncbi:MAG TPA: lipase maturation factor family protein [Thermoanaerobaculia bacterium]|nr:lipase maturation factor family protein [Thermoanaerobaculia bacterium]
MSGDDTGVPVKPSYWLTRFVILRLLGFVYLFAFLSLATQVLPLIGHDGLLPADRFLDRAAAALGSRGHGFVRLPSLFWLGISDGALTFLSWLGVGLSLVVLAGFADAVLMAALWALYMSFVHIGQDWYGYGWEIQLLETGFLAIFLCPLLDPRPFPRLPPPARVVWLFRWLIFRIMLGAGLIKIRGDSCWRDLTCLVYHYETQPIPNPLSRTLHFLPRWFHQGGVLFNHFAELVAPWFAFFGRRLPHAAGTVMLLLQVFLIASGNLSFLNWLTIVPILACFDDSLLRRVLPSRIVARAERAAASPVESPAQRIAVSVLVAVVCIPSLGPVTNLLSARQRMNTSFDPLELVNTYGAFGSVGRERDEIVFEGTDEAEIGSATIWKEYEFPCKPGDPRRSPCIVAPYQPRLAWQLWFAAMSTPDEYPWTLHLAWKLLHGDAGARRLLAKDPYPGRPPRWIRAQLYRYEFTRPGDPSGTWWTRTLVGPWFPPVSADDPRLLAFLSRYGWGTGGS